MELTLHESVRSNLIIDLFEACLIRQHDDDALFPDAVFSLVGESVQTESENGPLYKVLISAPDEQAKIAAAFVDGYMRGWREPRRRILRSIRRGRKRSR